jgi:hypothetical protein
MVTRTIGFEGAFDFKTPPGASENLCDYDFQTPAGLSPGRTKTPKEAAIGSFVQIQNSASPYAWIAQVVERRGPDYVVRHMKETKAGSKEYRLSPLGPWVIKEKAITQYNVKMHRFAKDLWSRWGSTAKKEASLLGVVTAPVSLLEKGASKRLEDDVQLIQAHAKRIRLTLDAIDHATANLSALWGTPIPE